MAAFSYSPSADDKIPLVLFVMQSCRMNVYPDSWDEEDNDKNQISLFSWIMKFNDNEAKVPKELITIINHKQPLQNLQSISPPPLWLLETVAINNDKLYLSPMMRKNLKNPPQRELLSSLRQDKICSRADFWRTTTP